MILIPLILRRLRCPRVRVFQDHCNRLCEWLRGAKSAPGFCRVVEEAVRFCGKVLLHRAVVWTWYGDGTIMAKCVCSIKYLWGVGLEQCASEHLPMLFNVSLFADATHRSSLNASSKLPPWGCSIVFLQAVAAYANFPVIPHFKTISVVAALKNTLLTWCAMQNCFKNPLKEPPPHHPRPFKYQLESLLPSSAADKSSKIASSVNTKDLFDITNNQDVLLSDCYLVSTMFFLFALETVKGELTVCCNQPRQGAFGIHSAALLKRCCGVIEIKSGSVFRCWRIN